MVSPIVLQLLALPVHAQAVVKLFRLAYHSVQSELLIQPGLHVERHFIRALHPEM